MEFILGCNYWASHAGTEMWVDWREDVVENDLKILSQNGIKYMRVFPNWRDFQPVEPLYCGGGKFYEYTVSEKADCDNPYFIDNIMMERFNRFCELAEQYHIKLIVGLVTGWMSGRLFIPVALNGKNIFSDPTALMFQQKFVRGFVEKAKNNQAIYAWDLGNECNCMSEAPNRETAYHWSATISNAIKASDSTRPIVSGMHTIGVEGTWTIQDQAETTDILTTHPYPYWVNHSSMDRIATIRTLLHATAETKYYSSVGGKNCLVEELGTMGPMICDDKTAADFMRVNLFSNWANGASGVMWWCANEQSNLKTTPYTWNMCERELGMLDNEQNPKPMLKEMKQFGEFLDTLDFTLPKAEQDAVCILTRGQDHWGMAYMTYILAKQAGMNLSFCYCEQELPESKLYILPSISGHLVMNKLNYDKLKQKAADGATLYISSDGGFLTEFEQLTGVKVLDSENLAECGAFQFDGATVEYQYNRKLYLKNTSAEVLEKVGENPMFTVNQYGKGNVYYLNMPLEKNQIEKHNAFEANQHAIYRCLAKKCFANKKVITNNPFLGTTIHCDGDKTYVVIVNYSDKSQDMNLKIAEGYTVEKVYHGDSLKLEPFDAFVSLISKN